MPQNGQINQGYYREMDELDKSGISNGELGEKPGDLSFMVDPKDEGVKVYGSIQLQPPASIQEKETKSKKEEEFPSVGFFSLFRFMSSFDVVLITIASLIALASGASMPAVMIIFGKVIDKLIVYDTVLHSNDTWPNTTIPPINMTSDEFLQATTELCVWNVVFSGLFIICNYIQVSFFSVAAANQAYRIRCRFMHAVLRQDITWYDTHQTGDFATRITGDLTRVQEGIGEKVGICLSFISSFLLCVGSGIYFGWKLALVILSISPVMTIAFVITSKIQVNAASKEQEAYGVAGAVAEEVISSIRTVVAFGGQKKEIDRFEKCLIPASRKAIKRGLLTGIGSALVWSCMFFGYALAFWYGVKLILESAGQEDPEYTGGKLIIIFFNIMSASMFIGQTAPYFEAFALARGAAAKIYSIIEREPEIDSSSDLGHKPNNLEGHIKLRDVHFNYPARPDVSVLKGLSMEVKPGETVALVGSSGCGKSTVIQLLLRFYDALSGSVEIDGINVKDLHLGWLRDRIGLVGQEPVLFSTTIEENIRMGRSDATTEDIVAAAKTANAHDFIVGLPEKYNTLVGNRGTQLSGGQKQRIAIARALVRNPRILLLDEATSALDTDSEAVVQAALDRARSGRTTVIVAHRLSTIRSADKILVLKEGICQESGTHDQLMEAKGLYYQLVVTQIQEEESDNEESEEDEDITDLERRESVLSAVSEDIPGQTPHRPSLNKQISVFSRQISTTSGKIPMHLQQRHSMVRQISAVGRQISSDDKDIEDEEILEKKVKLSRKRLMQLSSSEWPYILVGSICAILMGVHFPLYGIIFGDIIGLLSKSKDVIQEKTIYFCIIFLIMGITSFTCNFLQILLFSIAGEKLTFRLRNMVFANIITQDISFFDDPKNSCGSLCSRLNSDASAVQGATGSRISMAVQALSTLSISIFIGLYYNWKVGLASVGFVPLVLLAAALEARVISGQMNSDRKGNEDASKIATEAIDSIRTVASLHQEKIFYNQYCTALLKPYKNSRIQSHVRGLAYGFAQSITSLAYAVIMYYGSVLIYYNEPDFDFAKLLKICEAVLIGAMTVGQAAAFTPDYEKARLAVVRIFRLLDIRPTIDAFSDRGIANVSNKGSVHFSSVDFKYPSRPEYKVLRGLEASVKPGQTVALVGSSGCGKSTCVQLLERFYDPNRGKVEVDSYDIRILNVAQHRSQLALVSQEPVLFDGTIADNIAYGDNSRKPSMAEIIEVARQANIHSFVTGLPQGYDTKVGSRGTQLSGGQKQRIAIARALIRNPRILLLDEATSALDTESEKVVQEALDLARSGRTCLVIAHRLTTIQNADVILVFHRGKIVERGTHQELLNMKGIYYGLHNTQGVNS